MPEGERRATRFIDILIVEDRPIARKLLGDEIATAEDLRIIGEARNGAEGVRMVREKTPDVVIMDVVMPEMDGLEATAEIRKFSEVPIILLTGSHQNADTLRFLAKRRGANSFFLKPSGPVSADLYRIRDELLTEVRRLAGE